MNMYTCHTVRCSTYLCGPGRALSEHVCGVYPCCLWDTEIGHYWPSIYVPVTLEWGKGHNFPLSEIFMAFASDLPLPAASGQRRLCLPF